MILSQIFLSPLLFLWVSVCVFAVASMILYQLDLVLKKCFYPKSLFFIWCFFYKLHDCDGSEERRERERENINQLTFDWKVLFGIEYLRLSTSPTITPLFQSMLHFEEEKNTNTRTHKWCVSKKWYDEMTAATAHRYMHTLAHRRA